MWFLRKKPKDLSAMQAELLPGAEQLARENFGVTLDYSIESIKDVEVILGRLHENFTRSKSEEGIRGLAMAFAAYIVAVIEKHFGKGTWRRDHAELGPDTFPYEWRGSALVSVWMVHETNSRWTR